ncbi:hypothetical protein BaRGS_00013000 [Batillaria attramentaria]|uniref:Amidohydrolase-related domain-containing protein n=1 Tax=Batillaria attramentaria TaxID=370345 RepID=A0ABD0L8Z7_9CAEN
MATQSDTPLGGFVDSHFHIWDIKTTRFGYRWPREDSGVPFKYTPAQLVDVMKPTNVEHAVFVQVNNNCPEETVWLCELAEEYKFIKGIVAGLDPTDKDFGATLDRLSQNPRVVGIRHLLEFEEPDWLIRDDVIEGLKILESRGKTFDLQMVPALMKYVPTVSQRIPGLKMMVDHIAKPNIREGLFDDWAKDITKMAENPNMYCKISGMVTEVDTKKYTTLQEVEEQLVPYVKHVLDCFGPSRCMYGSDWPVSEMSGIPYKGVYDIACRLINRLAPGPENTAAIFRDNAVKFYGLNLDLM